MADSTMARFPVLAEEWNYQWGLVLKGIEQVWRATGDEKYFAYIQSNVDRFVQPDGTIRGYRRDEHNLDRLNTGKALFPLYEKTCDPKYKRALDLLRSQFDTHPRTPSGGFWHKQIYPNQMWLDGLYMGAAFWAEYTSVIASEAKQSPINELEIASSRDPSTSLRSAQDALLAMTTWDDIAHQFALIEQHTRDEKTGLLYHAWDESKQMLWANATTGRSPNVWARAMGWYAMALVDTLDHFPLKHTDRSALIAILGRTLDALASVQDAPSGGWYQIPDQGNRAGNYLESCASCMFVYAMAKGARKKYVSEDYARIAERALEGILTQFITTNSDGTINLTHTCQGAGLGGTPYRDGSFEYYINEPVVTNNHHGTGAFILASAEVELQNLAKV